MQSINISSWKPEADEIKKSVNQPIYFIKSNSQQYEQRMNVFISALKKYCLDKLFNMYAENTNLPDNLLNMAGLRLSISSSYVFIFADNALTVFSLSKSPLKSLLHCDTKLSNCSSCVTSS